MDTMIDGIVVHASKYGSTSEYASWVAGELRLPLLLPRWLDDNGIPSCGYLIIGSPVYKGRLLISKWLHIHRKALTRKRLFFFIVSTTRPEEKEKQETIVQNNIPKELVQDGNTFFLPGRIIIKDLSLIDNEFLKLIAKLEKDPLKRAAMLKGIDGVAKQHIAPLIARVEALVEQVL